jgi:centrosomal protein CEP120
VTLWLQPSHVLKTHTAEHNICHPAQAEEVRFRAQLQELEQQRMGVIEAAWRAREAQRQSEIKALKTKYSGLEKQTRELLTATQERERVQLAAEAELRLRKAGLEREAAARMSEAEAAVRRLQVGDESV